MKVISVDPAADPRWLAFLNHMPEATLFYHPSWMKTLDEAYGYPQCCLGVEENGEIIGVLPLMEIDSWITGKRGVCLPFTDSCGPLTVTPDATALLLDTLASDRRRRGWKYAEVRTRADHPGARQTAEYKYHRLMVSGDVQSMFSRLNKKRTQWSIQKAESSRVVVERRTDREALDEFVRLNDLTRRKHGIPPQPRRFSNPSTGTLSHKAWASSTSPLSMASLPPARSGSPLIEHSSTSIPPQTCATLRRAPTMLLYGTQSSGPLPTRWPW